MYGKSLIGTSFLILIEGTESSMYFWVEVHLISVYTFSFELILLCTLLKNETPFFSKESVFLLGIF